MKMNEYLTALQTHLTTQQSPNQNILDLLYDAYNDTTGMDNEEIKADFEKLYQIMNGKPLQEIDEICVKNDIPKCDSCCISFRCF